MRLNITDVNVELDYRTFPQITFEGEVLELGPSDIKALYTHTPFEYSKFLNEIANSSMPKIKNVIFNDPATIVFWTDGSKTVVKAQDGDIFDPEKGLAMAISKKALGNKGNYCNELKKWLPKEEEPEEVSGEVAAEIMRNAIRDAMQNVNKKPLGRFGV